MTRFILSRFFFPVIYGSVPIFMTVILWRRDPAWAMVYWLGLAQGLTWLILSRRAPGAAR